MTLDNVNGNNGPAPKQSDVDWFGFNQNGPANKAGGDTTGQKPQPQGPGDDPYDKNQGAPAKPAGPGTPEKPDHGGHDKPHGPLTLYDVAERELRHSHTEIKSQDDVYRKLNEIMVAHGHQKANLDGRTGINDHMLPKEWNSVNPKSLLEHHDGDKPHPHPAKHHEPKEHHPKPEQPHERPPQPTPQDRTTQAVPRPAEQPQYPYAPQPQPQYQYAPQPQYHAQPYNYNNPGNQIGNVIGSVLGGIGAGLLFGRGYGYGYPYYGGGYGYGGPVIYGGGGWHGGWHHRR